LSPSEEVVLVEVRRAGLDVALVHLTPTGLRKSILDATDPIRETLRRGGVHCYDEQAKGTDHKVNVDSKFLTLSSFERRRVSLYRPATKQGDPRLWIAKLTELAKPDDIIAIGCERQELVIINVTRWADVPIDHLRERISTVIASRSPAAIELLERLRKLAVVPIPATTDGDTAIGRAVETALGIRINSSKAPDFNGIELKSHREERSATRLTLFAQVPCWAMSRHKSSRAILDAYGYETESVRKLYCQLSSVKPNSQGLRLRIDIDAGLLSEVHSVDGEVCKWRLSKLHDRLLGKHRETFWIAAREVEIGGKIHFQLESARHTRAPSTAGFDLLVSHGHITVDHLIKRDLDGSVSEKGPLFKVSERHLDGLFLGQQLSYKLTA
jgi:hypothetical protein